MATGRAVRQKFTLETMTGRGANHDRDVDHNKTHGKADAREDGKEGNFMARIQRNPYLREKLQALLVLPLPTVRGAAVSV